MSLSCVAERKNEFDFLSKLHKANQFNIENRRTLSKCMLWNMRIVKLLSWVFLATVSACFFFPVSVSVMNGRMEPIFPTKIPFIPVDEFWGYTIHCAYFFCALVSAYCGTLAYEVITITSTMHLWAMQKIINNIIVGLNQATRSLRMEAVRNSTWLHRRVRNILLMHREYHL